MSAVTESQPAKKWAMPDTLVIIFFVAILTSLATWVVPVGMFDSQEVQYQVDGQTKTRKVVDPHSFRILTNEAGEEQYHPVKFFTTGDERPGLMNFPFEGLTSGSKFGTAVGIIMFMLVIGGAFGIVMRTGTIDNGILALIRHTRGNEVLFIPVLFILFSLGGAVFGMGEEAVAFAIIIAPLMVRLGYDSITTVLVTYIATQIGFASSWMNPFCVVVAQGIAGVPVLSGSGLRIVVWVVATLIGLTFTLAYAARIKKNPLLSRVAKQNDKTKAAIAAKENAELYGLDILAEDINTSEQNTTRFIIIGKKLVKEGNRFSMIFTAKHEAGALVKAMEVISKHGFNMESIKSRSIKNKPWAYYFYVEIDGNLQDTKVVELLMEMNEVCEDVKLLGAYTKESRDEK